MTHRLGRWHVVDPMIEKHYDYTPYAYVYNNPLIFVDPLGLDSIYFYDQANNPNNKRVYTAEVYVEVNGKVSGPYKGSTYPNAPDSNNGHKTANSGLHEFNNEFGHKGGSVKGLNLVDSNGDRKTPAKTTLGNKKVDAEYVNVHSGVDPKENNGFHNRGSAACLTIYPDDTDSFFNNFDWSGSYNGYSGNTGNSTGTVFINRGDGLRTKEHLQRKQIYQKAGVGHLYNRSQVESILNSLKQPIPTVRDNIR